MSKDIDELTASTATTSPRCRIPTSNASTKSSAQDFYCSNPDKSLVDRAGFLKQTAVPVTIRNLDAHDVKIRVMGDFAIIHAPHQLHHGGRPAGLGRYTDCWARQNGQWLAVSAHVSR